MIRSALPSESYERHSVVAIPTGCHSARNCAPGLPDGVAVFRSPSEAEIDLGTFAAEGRAIAPAMKAELPDWSTTYFDEAAAARAK